MPYRSLTKRLRLGRNRASTVADTQVLLVQWIFSAFLGLAPAGVILHFPRGSYPHQYLQQRAWAFESELKFQGAELCAGSAHYP